MKTSTQFYCLIFSFFVSSLPIKAETVDFSLIDTNGTQYQLSDYKGKWVIVNFWATWCGPCIKELPEFIKFQKMHPEHIVLGINFEKISNEDLTAFKKEQQINYPILRIGSIPLIPFEPLKGLPTTGLVSPEGVLLAKHAGTITVEMLENFISKNN